MTTQNIEKSKKKYGTKHLILGLVIFIFFIMISGLLSSGSNENNSLLQTQQKSNDSFLEKTKDVLQSQEKRFGCEDGEIKNLTGVDLAKTKTIFKVMDGIRTNIVEYPLNKKEVMMEYCITVANLTSDIRSLKLLVQFLDKNNNTLVEKDDYVFDVPGRRTKTIYGSVFVETQLSKEIISIRVK